LLLYADPKAGEQNSERKLDLSKLFKSGYDDLLKGLVEKEVKSVDQDSIKARAEYYQKHFGIALGTSDHVADLTKLFQIRNNISLNPNEIRIPTPKELATVRNLVLSIPSKILEAACNRYPQMAR
jgi:hypothetical protein